MKYSKYFFVAAALIAISAYAQDSKTAPLSTVDYVDIDRYAGTWYEIARLPMPYQNQCAANVTAEYRPNDDGTITVINRCQKVDGNWSVAEGLAKATSEDNSQLTVTFLPKIIRWLPIGQAPYWVMGLDDEYQTAMVGQPDRKYLWLLSRTPVMDSATYTAYLDKAKAEGYQLDGLIKTKHDTPLNLRA